MSDFDFDELDKAVTGALGDPLATSEASQPTSILATRAVADHSPVVVSDPRPTARSVAVPAANRGGRFMDVVHPSSDMRTPAPSQAEAVSSQPQVMGLPRIPKPPTFNTSGASRPAVEYSPAVEDASSHEPADWSKPLESPFLPDAKVEKRPLGGTGSEFDLSSLPLAFEEEEQELLEAPEEELLLEATTMPDPIEFAASQPTESEKSVEEEVSTSEPTPVPVPAPVELAEPSTPAYEEPSTPIAITQQYKEKQSDEQESGAIYDTESYHQPLVKPPKKRSGAWTVLWIVLLVLLGAGVGVACFFYVLPLL